MPNPFDNFFDAFGLFDLVLVGIVVVGAVFAFYCFERAKRERESFGSDTAGKSWLNDIKLDAAVPAPADGSDPPATAPERRFYRRLPAGWRDYLKQIGVR